MLTPIEFIEDELELFKNKEIITKEYKELLEKGYIQYANGALDSIGLPNLEMDRVTIINDVKSVKETQSKTKKTKLWESDNYSSAKCEKNGTMKIVLKYESVFDLPIPDVKIEVYDGVRDMTIPSGEVYVGPILKLVDLVVSDKTDNDGTVVFSGLTPGKTYYIRATDDKLIEHNQALYRAYDDLVLTAYERLAAQWPERKQKWLDEPLGENILETFKDSVWKGFISVWDDVTLAWDLLTDPIKYIEEFNNAKTKLGELLNGITFDLSEIQKILEEDKQKAKEFLALTQDEALMYIVGRYLVSEIVSYPWGKVLNELVKIGGSLLGELLRGMLFGAILSVVNPVLGPIFLSLRIIRAGLNLINAVNMILNPINIIISQASKLVAKFFKKIKFKNAYVKSTGDKFNGNKINYVTNNQTTVLTINDDLGKGKGKGTSTSETPSGKKSQTDKDTKKKADPISMVTGEELLLLDDATLLGLYPFAFQRQYRTTAVEINSVFGYGWSHSLQHHFLFNDENNTIIWTDHENLINTLDLPSKDMPISANKLAIAAVWLSEKENEYLFTAACLNGWVMHVNRLSDNHGQVTAFSQNKQKLLVHYDPERHLPVKLENPAGASLLFYYIETEQGDRLSEIRLARHITIAGSEPQCLIRYAYDEQGQLSEVINPVNEVERYEYRSDFVFTKRQLAGGAEFYWEWIGEGKSVRALRQWSNIPNTEINFKWDTATGTSEAIYADGSKEIFVHDKQTARLLKTVSANGTTTTRHYGQDGELIAEIDPAGHVTEFDYDDELHCTLMRFPDGQVVTNRYNRGLLMERTHYSADRLEIRREKWRYDYDGNLITYIDPMKLETNYRWSENGSLSAVIYPDNTSERYTFNALGQLLEYQNTSGEVMYYRYNALGQLIFESTTDPNSTNNIDAVRATRWVWDDIGRLVAVHWPDGTSRKFSYNPYGGVTKEIDEKQRVTHFEYHQYTSLIKRIYYPDNSYTQYEYNNIHGEISDIINHNGDRYHIDYTPTGKVQSERLFDGRRIFWEYDANDQIIKRTEYGDSGRQETALVTQYERDIHGRLIARTLPDGQKIAYRYNGFGQLLEVDDGQWPLVWQYDKCGRLIQEHQGFSSQYFDYDAVGRLYRMRMPDGNILAYHYHGDNVSQIDLNGQPLSTHRWQQGQEIARTLGRFGELNCRNQFDSMGRLLHQRITVGDNIIKPIERHYQYNQTGELTQITDTYKGIKKFTHDLNGRLASANHKPYNHKQLPDELSFKGYHEQFIYDGANNLLSCDAPLDALKGDKQSNTTSSSQVSANRLKIQGDRHYEYDEYGNVIKELRGKRQHTEHQFKWDCQHRLIEFKKIRHYRDNDFHQAVETVHTYTYDAFGRRISKTDKQTGDKTLFFWQGNKLITECHADDADFSPSAVRNQDSKAEDYRCCSYIYEPSEDSFIPLAQLQGRGRGGQIYYYLTDQLGTPQELISANGDIVWSGIYKSYGQIAIAAGTTAQNLRFQGQYFDQESGLHYNRNRYYDPYCGRFFSQDPIGLYGGENTYAYVFDPLAWIDPLGLAKVPNVKKNQAGVITSASATVTKADIGTGTRTNQKARDWARSRGNNDDDAGHILGALLGGSGTDLDNIFPQLRKINRGAYRVFEGKIREYIEEHGTVNLEWEFVYANGGTRPTKIIYTVKQKGRVVLYEEFNNQI